MVHLPLSVAEYAGTAVAAAFMEQPVVYTAAALTIDRWVGSAVNDFFRSHLNVTIASPKCASSAGELGKYTFAKGAEVFGGGAVGYFVAKEALNHFVSTSAQLATPFPGGIPPHLIPKFSQHQYFAISLGLHLVKGILSSNQPCPSIPNPESDATAK
jgi:hypothetical protein